jgi:hypothetical protein
MNLSTPVVLKANVLVETFDVRTGEKLSESRHSNMAVDSGLNLLRDFLYGDGPTHITHGAVGTDTAATVAGDTALTTEVFRDVIAARVKGTQSLTLQFVLGSTHANGSTLTEAGLFNASSGGTMYARVVTSAVNKTALVSVLYTWTLSFANA